MEKLVKSIQANLLSAGLSYLEPLWAPRPVAPINIIGHHHAKAMQGMAVLKAKRR